MTNDDIMFMVIGILLIVLSALIAFYDLRRFKSPRVPVIIAYFLCFAMAVAGGVIIVLSAMGYHR